LKDEVVIFEEILWPGGKLFSAQCIHTAAERASERRKFLRALLVGSRALLGAAAALLFDNLS
jgi:hypothetical protein